MNAKVAVRKEKGLSMARSGKEKLCTSDNELGEDGLCEVAKLIAVETLQVLLFQ
jgi:hypothetical protein